MSDCLTHVCQRCRDADQSNCMITMLLISSLGDRFCCSARWPRSSVAPAAATVGVGVFVGLVGYGMIDAWNQETANGLAANAKPGCGPRPKQPIPRPPRCKALGESCRAEGLRKAYECCGDPSNDTWLDCVEWHQDHYNALCDWEEYTCSRGIPWKDPHFDCFFQPWENIPPF
jgi:hypothetical protein